MIRTRALSCGASLGVAALLAASSSALAQDAATSPEVGGDTAETGEGAPPTSDASAAPSAAEEARLEEARMRLGRGEALYDAGDFEGALAEFRALDALLEGHPLRGLATYNMARAAERLFRYDEAVALYERYLAAPDPDARYASAAREKLELLRSLLSALTIVVRIESEDPPSWELWIDGHRVGSELSAGDPVAARVPGGRHAIEARAEGFPPAADEIEVVGGTELRIELVLREPSRGLDPAPFLVATTVAAIVGIAAAVLGPITLGEHDRLSACAGELACAEGAGWIDRASGAPTDAFRAEDARLTGMAIATDVLLGLAGAAAVTAIVLAPLTEFGGAEPERADLRLELGAPGAVAGFSMRGTLE